MSETLLETKNVTKIFEVKTKTKKEKLVAVENVSINIEKGRDLVIVGESGSGKSTLGKIVLGLMKPDFGTVLYKGKDIWKMTKEEWKNFRRNAQIIHQDPYSSLNPMRTIFQTLSPPLIQYNLAKSSQDVQKRVSELLSLVGLVPPSDFMNRYPSRMSGGQMQRVAIARAISINPELIVADEAVSMLDASLRVEIVDLLLNLKNKLGTSFLFITHDFGIARYFIKKGGGKVAVMYLGNIVELGEGDSVIQKPMHPYTKALIASVPIPDPVKAKASEVPSLRSLDLTQPRINFKGCKFASRCSYVREICSNEAPLLRLVDDREVACHLYD
jgi:oligopeptide/dipeptide ABC transporter ATP-binding protein